MSHKLYKEIIKTELKKAIESGQFNNEQCIAMIDAAVKDLSVIDNPVINKAITEFRKTIQAEEEKLIQLSENISKEYKEMYEDIIKDM